MNKIRAIDAVIKAWRDHQACQPKISTQNTDTLVKAITEIAQTTFNSKFSYKKKLRQNPLSGIAIQEIVKIALPKIKFKPKVALLRQIGRSRDENLHSDFINALIKQPDLTPYILQALKLSGKLISSKRESRLDQIDKTLRSSDLGAKRIDILIETDQEVLIIENKQETLESHNQTTDYYNCLKGNSSKIIKGILLAPQKMDAQCPHFVPMSYYELFFILERVYFLSSTPLLEQYLSELFEIFIKPYQVK